MFWIIVIVGFGIYLFISTKKEEVTKVQKQGGFYLKYRELLDYFYHLPNIQVERKTNTSIIFAVKDKYVVTRFTVAHGFEDVSIFWNHQSAMFGNHSLNWNFPESLPQSQMLVTMQKELGLYERNLVGDGF